MVLRKIKVDFGEALSPRCSCRRHVVPGAIIVDGEDMQSSGPRLSGTGGHEPVSQSRTLVGRVLSYVGVPDICIILYKDLDLGGPLFWH